MAAYDENNIPTQTSWINKITKEQASLQCVAWGITPMDTAEGNRSVLRAFVKARKKEFKEKNAGENSPHTSDSESNDEGDDRKPTIDTKATNSQPTSSGNQADVLELIRNMHSESMKITMAAVTQVVGAIGSPRDQSSKTDPSILGELMKEIRPNNGMDPTHNVRFLLKIDSILESIPDSEREVIPKILPFTKDKLRDFWQKLGKENATWKDIVSKFIAKFFTPDSLRQVKEEFLFRPQRNRESLEDYVASITRSFKILSPDAAEQEIFDTIFFKISSETRTSLNSVGLMKSLQDFKDAAPRADAITQATTTALPTHSSPSAGTHTSDYRTNDRHTTNSNHNRPYSHNTEGQYRPRYNSRQFHPGRNTRPNNYGRGHGQQYTQYRPGPAVGFTPGHTDNSAQVRAKQQQNREALNARGRY